MAGSHSVEAKIQQKNESKRAHSAWYFLYFALALLDVVTVLLSIGLNLDSSVDRSLLPSKPHEH